MNLIQQADSAFSKLARLSRADKAGQVECICCGRPFHWTYTDCGHFVVRGNMALRYDLDNCWPVCRACHSKPTHTTEYENALVKKKGQEFVDRLRQRGHQYFRAQNDQEMEALVQELTYKLSLICC